MGGEAAIELRHLGKEYGPKQALRDVSLSVGWGEVFGYVGANGAGKTTTIKILTGLIRPTSGDALVGGRSVLDQPLEVKARLGYVPESGALFEKFSRRTTLIGRLYRLSKGASATGWASTRSPWRRTNRWASFQGTSRRSAGSRAAHVPVLVLDEPLSSLDVGWPRQGNDARLAQQDRTIFYYCT